MPTDPNIQKVETEKQNSKGGILDFLKNSGALKDIIKGGTEILAALTRCAIKPKGTPHREIWQKAPKFFYLYTNGKLPNEKGFASMSGYFDITNGRALDFGEIELSFSIEKRKAFEATLRKKCESVTGVIDYYIEPQQNQDYAGYVRLSDGKNYDAKKYGIKGGTNSNPILLPNVNPLGTTQTPVDNNPNLPTEAQQTGLGNLAGVALLGFLLSRG